MSLLVYGNKLDILNQLFSITRLQSLELDFNQLASAIPTEIGRNWNRHVDTDNNRPVGKIPSQFGELQKLIRLDFSSNNLAEIPIEIDQLTNLRILWLHQNMNILGRTGALDRISQEAVSLVAMAFPWIWYISYRSWLLSIVYRKKAASLRKREDDWGWLCAIIVVQL